MLADDVMLFYRMCGKVCCVLADDVMSFLQVNQVLDIKFKTFIRIVACFPEKVINFDFTNTMSGLEYSEKVSFSCFPPHEPHA